MKDIKITSCEISSSHGGEYDVQSCLLMMEAVRTSETSVDNHFTRQYIPEDNSEHKKTSCNCIFSVIRIKIFQDSKDVSPNNILDSLPQRS
jgi:hypothetical protein